MIFYLSKRKFAINPEKQDEKLKVSSSFLPRRENVAMLLFLSQSNAAIVVFCETDTVASSFLRIKRRNQIKRLLRFKLNSNFCHVY